MATSCCHTGILTCLASQRTEHNKEKLVVSSAERMNSRRKQGSTAPIGVAQPFPDLRNPDSWKSARHQARGLVTGNSLEAKQAQGTWTLLMVRPHLQRNAYCLTRCNRYTSTLPTRMGGQKKKSPRRQIKVGAQILVWDEKLFLSRTNKISGLTFEASMTQSVGVGWEML